MPQRRSKPEPVEAAAKSSGSKTSKAKPETAPCAGGCGRQVPKGNESWDVYCRACGGKAVKEKMAKVGGKATKLDAPARARGQTKKAEPKRTGSKIAEQKAKDAKAAERKRTRAKNTRKAREMAAKKKAFLEALSVHGGIITMACWQADISRQRVFEWRREDAEFEMAYGEALDEAADITEREIMRRAEEGVRKPVIHQGHLSVFPARKDGTPLPTDEHPDFDHFEPLTITEYSDKLLELRIKALRPDRYREVRELRGSGAGGAIKVDVHSKNRDQAHAILGNPKTRELAGQIVAELFQEEID